MYLYYMLGGEWKKPTVFSFILFPKIGARLASLALYLIFGSLLRMSSPFIGNCMMWFRNLLVESMRILRMYLAVSSPARSASSSPVTAIL